MPWHVGSYYNGLIMKQLDTRVRLLIGVLLLGLIVGPICVASETEPSPTPAQPSEVNRSWSLANGSIVSDFDGDNQPDLATGQHEGSNYKVEIQFSTGRERASFVLPSTEAEISLFAYDLDLDNDNDIVVASATSLRPLAVWINDGHGHFEKGNCWLASNSLRTNILSIRDPNGNQEAQASIRDDNRLIYDISRWGPIPTKLEARGSVLGEPDKPYLQTLSDRRSARSPPRNTVL